VPLPVPFLPGHILPALLITSARPIRPHGCTWHHIKTIVHPSGPLRWLSLSRGAFGGPWGGDCEVGVLGAWAGPGLASSIDEVQVRGRTSLKPSERSCARARVRDGVQAAQGEANASQARGDRNLVAGTLGDPWRWHEAVVAYGGQSGASVLPSSP
jgi:hypothetical protein